MVTACPDPSVLEAFGQGTLDPASRDALDVHLDRCSACASVVAQLTELFGSASVEPDALAHAGPDTIDGALDRVDSPAATGLLIGRYRLGRLLGAGGMGMVYEAVDPELARRVAIKLLHPGTGGDIETTRRRMLREARAMAQLAHPNVVAVHDVGRFGAQVFVAMELVEGTTLTRWLQAQVRSRRELLATFVQAGRGLEAAHAVGLVHRDFKPDNVLVGADGRVRVTDFGLARPTLTWPDEAQASSVVAARAAGLGATLEGHEHSTVHGAVVGTPAYMAPEQWRGEPADARSDQFSFCVALYEACFGVRPFAGDGLYALAEQVLRGNMVPPPRAAPTWLRAAIVRGLQPDPDARHPSMQVLLAALERDRKRALRIVGVAAAMAASVAATVAVLAWTTAVTSPSPALLELPTAPQAESIATEPAVAPEIVAPRSDPQLAACVSRSTDAEGRWNPQRRTKLDTHLRTMDDGDAIAERSLLVLDRWAQRWTGLAARACAVEPTFVHVDAQRRCLAEALPRFDALVQQVLDLATFSVDDSVASAAYRLPDLSVCERPEWLAVAPAGPTPARVGEATILRGDLAMAEALTGLDQLSHAPDALEGVVERAKTLGHAPLLAEAQLALGLAQAEKYETQAATVALEAAAMTAQGGVHDRVLARAGLLLVEQYGGVQLRLADADRWQRLVATLESRLGDPWLAGALLTATGVSLDGRAEYRGALASFEAALPKLVEALGPGHPEVARVLLATAQTQLAFGQFDRADATVDRAIDLLAASIGGTDLRYAAALAGRARIALARGALAEAREAADKVVKLPSISQSLRHDFDRGAYLGVLGDVMAAQGSTAEALATYEQAKVYLYVDAPKVLPLLWQGRLLIATDDLKAGLVRLDEARAELELHFEKDDPRRIDPLCAIGRAQRQAKRFAGARATLEAALELANAELGAGPRTSLVKWELAALEVDQGHTAAALELYDDAHVWLTSAFELEDPRLVESLLARADLAWALGQHEYGARLYDGIVDDLSKQWGPKDARAARARARRAHEVE